MTLTKSQILSWDLSVLTAVGAAWTALGSKIEDLFARYKHAVVAVNNGHWEGETADAAVGRAGSDERTAVQVMAHLARAAKIATDGFHLVSAPLQRARQAIADTIAAGYTVREDLSVYKDGKSTEADEKAMLKWANTIKAEADATEAADKQVKTSLNGTREDLRIAFAAPGAPGAPPAPPRGPGASESLVGEAGALPDLLGEPPTAPAAPDPAAGSLPWLLSHARNTGATTAPPVPPSPQEVESFKVQVREMLASQGVPPDQIEAQVNAALASAQQPLPHSVVPQQQPNRQPAPGFGEGFGDAWRATEQGIENLLGQGGPGAPGVLDSWAGLAKGAAETLTNPIGTAIAEVQHALNAPSAAYALGEKAFDIGAAAATLPLGGEGAAVRAGLPEANALGHGLLPDVGQALVHDPAAAIPHPAIDAPMGDFGGNGLPHIDMTMKEGWSDFQQSQMQSKVEQFNSAVGDAGFTQTPPGVRDPAIRQLFLENLGLDRVPPGYHVDHIQDLQAGGLDVIGNMALLDGSVNMSFGAQLNAGMNRFLPGTTFGGVRLPDP